MDPDNMEVLVYVENVKTIVPQTIQPMWRRGMHVGLIYRLCEAAF